MATIDDVKVKDVIFYYDRMYHLVDLGSCTFCSFCHLDSVNDEECFIPEDFPVTCEFGKVFERIYI